MGLNWYYLVMKKDTGFESLGNLFTQFSAQTAKVKPPAHEWQDLALRVIAEMGVPNFKRNSVFKICKDNSKEAVERAMNDTKELCKTGSRWSYFFKVIDSENQKNKKAKEPENKAV